MVPSDPDEAFVRGWIRRYEDGWRDGSRAGSRSSAPTAPWSASRRSSSSTSRAGKPRSATSSRPRGAAAGSPARAVALLTDWGFETLGLVRLELRIDIDNGGSERVAERLGYVPRRNPSLEALQRGPPRQLRRLVPPERRLTAGRVRPRRGGDTYRLSPMSAAWHRPLVREAVLSAVGAAALAGALLWLGPPGVDLAAHAYQRTFLLQHGFAVWNNFWYAGRYSFVTYSFIYYPLAVAARDQAARRCSRSPPRAAGFALARRARVGPEGPLSSRTFVILWPGVVLTAAFPFLLGSRSGSPRSSRCSAGGDGSSRSASS